MMAALVHSKHGVTLVGGGQICADQLDRALALAPDLVAADGGANWLHDLGRPPDAIIGDIDSLRPELRKAQAGRIHRIPDQDSTDFDKCLNSIRAPHLLALGFSGARLDHTLASMSSLARFGSARVILLGASDICFLAPPHLTLPMRPDARLSLFPMARVSGRSRGLRWPIKGLDFAPDGIIGTSNRATGGVVELEFDARGMLVLLAADSLQDVLRAVTTAPDWPA
ncbi:MAG: thiamine diphosphokinase [Rhodobacteraceae bacterium]|nr:thiamine diphosphokinase [Paracoccaceae bacterium]